MQIIIQQSKQEGALFTARQIAASIQAAQQQNKSFVWGLPTGSSPIPVYAELVRLHREEGLSFENVVTFNMDEYYPLPPTHAHSFYTYTHQHLLNHVNIPPANSFFPDSTAARPQDACRVYDEAIAAAGGFDLLLLGIGNNGHIAFNEPGTPFNTYTNLVTLTQSSRLGCAMDFGSLDSVPACAISIGMRHVLEARGILLTAWGQGKAAIINQCLTGEPTETLPASILQQHAHCSIVLDEAAAALIKEKLL